MWNDTIFPANSTNVLPPVGALLLKTENIKIEFEMFYIKCYKLYVKNKPTFKGNVQLRYQIAVNIIKEKKQNAFLVYISSQLCSKY